MAFDLNEIIQTLYRGLISLICLFLITKLLGRKQVSQLTLFDYVIGISIGNFAAEMTINMDAKEINGIIAVVEFGVIAYLVSYLTMKSMTLRNLFTGPPTVLIEKGQLLYKNLKKVHFDMNDLLQQLRINGYFDINDVEYALMEANGQVSILPKKKNQPVTIEDLNLKEKNDGLVANLIIDSKLIKTNLKNVSKTEKWLKNQLKVKGYSSYDDILLATIDNNDKLVVFKKNTKDEKSVLD